MKNQFTSRIVKLTFAFMFVLIASSCSQDDEAMDAAALANEINSEIAAKGAKVNATVTYGTLSYGSTDDICLGDPVTITFNNDQGFDHGNYKMQLWGPNDTDWVNITGSLSSSTGGIVSYTFTPVDLGEYDFRGDWNRTGGAGVSTGWVEVKPLFTVVDCTPCTNELSVVLTCGETRTATFTFTAEEAGPIVIQGGLTNGTTITSASSNVLTRNVTHSGVTNSKANVTRWEGNVDACQVVTITIQYTGGAGIDDWSAKRGDDTLGSTEAQTCN
jgi:hypothetical protein